MFVVYAATSDKERVRIASFDIKAHAWSYIKENKHVSIIDGCLYEAHSLLKDCVHAWVEEEDETPHNPQVP